MNILHLISQSDSYDAVFQAIDLSKHLIAKGHNSIIVSSLDFSVLKYDVSTVQVCYLPLYEMNIWHSPRNYKTIRKIIRDNKIDIIHSYSPITSWIALFVSRASAIPFVTSCKSFYPRGIFNSSMALGKNIIIHHEALGMHLLERFKVPRFHLKLIKESLDLGNFDFQTPDERSKTDFIIAVATPIRPNSGFEPFLKGMVKATRIVPNIKISLCDNLPHSKLSYKKELALFVRRLGLNRHVEFNDASGLNLNILSKANILVSPFVKEEALTRSIIEAQARGVCVIASRVAGVAEIISDNETGIFVLPNDHNAITDATVKLLRNFNLARNIALAARIKVEENNNLNNTIDYFIDAYKSTIEDKRILIVNLGSIQDSVLSFPALEALRKKMPNANLVNLSNSSLSSLFRACPYINDLLSSDSSLIGKSILGYIKTMRLIIRQRFDIVVDLTNTIQSEILSWASLASRRYGIRNRIFGFLINCGISKPKGEYGSLKEKLAIASKLTGEDVVDYRLELWPSTEDKEFVSRLLSEHWVGNSRIIGLDISSKNNPFKNGAFLDCYTYLCDILAGSDMRVVLLGLKRDVNIKEELVQRLHSRPISAVGDISVMQLASLIKRCDIYIGSNPEFLQLASAMKVPSIILSAMKKSNELPVSSEQFNGFEILTSEDIKKDMVLQNRRRFAVDSLKKSIVLNKVNNLIKHEDTAYNNAP